MRNRAFASFALLSSFVALTGGCSAAPTAPENGSAQVSARASIPPDRAEVVVYEDLDETPSLVPVVVSYKANKPSALFRIACGGGFDVMMQAFGFLPGSVDLDTVQLYKSFDKLEEQLQLVEHMTTPIPAQTLTCYADAALMHDQILRVFRRTDANVAGGEAEYYLRFPGDPSAVYSVGCANFLEAFGWGASAEAMTATTPINRAVLDTWTAPVDPSNPQSGVAIRAISCTGGSAKPLPAAPRELPVSFDTPVSPEPELFKIPNTYFPDIPTRKVYYLIAGGRGYALYCPASPDGLMSAFGFPPGSVVPDLTDANKLLASRPGEQPELRCATDGVSLYEPSDVEPRLPYYRFGTSDSLVQFTCGKTNRFFASGLAHTADIPNASAPWLLRKRSDTDTPGALLRIGCKLPEDAPRPPLEVGPWYEIEPVDGSTKDIFSVLSVVADDWVAAVGRGTDTIVYVDEDGAVWQRTVGDTLGKVTQLTGDKKVDVGAARSAQYFARDNRLFVVDPQGLVRSHELGAALGDAVAVGGVPLARAASVFPLGDQLVNVDTYGYAYTYPFAAQIGRGLPLVGPRARPAASPVQSFVADGRLVTVDVKGTLWAQDMGTALGPMYAVKGGQQLFLSDERAVLQTNRIVTVEGASPSGYHWGYDLNPPHCGDDQGRLSADTPARGRYCAPRSAYEPGWHDCGKTGRWAPWSPRATCNDHPDKLRVGETLVVGDYLRSPNGKFFLVQQDDGNLVEYVGQSPADMHGVVWAHDQYPGAGDYYATILADGRLGTFKGTKAADGGASVWLSPNAASSGAFYLAIRDDANLVVYRDNGPTATPTVVWQTGKLATVGSIILEGERLLAGEYLRSRNGKYLLTQQNDGNLVAYVGTSLADAHAPFWSTKWTSAGDFFLELSYGDLTTYRGTPSNPGEAWWTTGTSSNSFKRTFLELADDGHVNVWEGGPPINRDRLVWQSDRLPPP